MGDIPTDEVLEGWAIELHLQGRPGMLLAEARRARSEAKVLRGTLEQIARVRFGAADDWSERELYEYWSRLALEYRDTARTALAATGERDSNE